MVFLEKNRLSLSPIFFVFIKQNLPNVGSQLRAQHTFFLKKQIELKKIKRVIGRETNGSLGEKEVSPSPKFFF